MFDSLPDQAESRTTATYRDPHGREWLTVIDTRARTVGKVARLAPCVPFIPKGWNAPAPALVPPQKYLTIPDGSLGVVTVDYEAWLTDLRESARGWKKNLHTAAVQLYGQQAAAAIQAPPPELLAAVGRPPIPEEFIRAMRGGKSAWVLGLAPAAQVPAWAQPLLPQLYDVPAVDEDGDDFTDDAFADDAAPVALDLDADAASGEPLDPYGALEEQYDADAVGGHTVPARGRGGRRKAA